MPEPAAPLSDERLAEIRSVQLGCWYSGEWRLNHPSGSTGPVQIVHTSGQGDTVLAELPDFAVDIAVFIADAHEAVPELLAEVDRLRVEHDELLAELDGRDEEARERWINKQLDETGLRSMDFRNGMHMDIEPARELVAHFVGAARAMLGDGPNYSETKLEFDVKVAESPELYTFVVQRHGRGVLTPHEARQKAEQERDEALVVLQEVREAQSLGAALAAVYRHDNPAAVPPEGGQHA